jgi:hypothetical protein
MFQTQPAVAQAGTNERVFPQSRAAIEKALRQLQPSMSGRLPVLEGFAAAGDHPLNAYRRGFFQMTAQVNSNPADGSVVRLTTKITAWYSDSTAAHSGYQLLTSNGRLEADLLDQLADQLALETPITASKAAEKPQTAPSKTTSGAGTSNQSAAALEPTLSAPMPRLPNTGGTFSTSLPEGLAANARGGSAASSVASGDSKLEAEAAGLEDVLKNQAHPKNLVAVKKSGTPVVSTPSLNAKTLFLASAHDEFEMLNFNRDWVHVRISGLSRGWIWRNSLELPESVPDVAASTSAVPFSAAELFRVSREETAPFPGDWAPLRGKSVKIVSVEKGGDPGKDSGAQLKLEFAKSILDQDYKELAQKPDTLAGIVVIFDSSDGGMIAATFSTLQQWKAGRLSDSALWHQCFFDPPETFVPSGSPGSK